MLHIPIVSWQGIIDDKLLLTGVLNAQNERRQIDSCLWTQCAGHMFDKQNNGTHKNVKNNNLSIGYLSMNCLILHLPIVNWQGIIDDTLLTGAADNEK